ncbi:unnamed protein product [Darwinula stevensoni]|uniref:Spaetzle domain-containing protein n=1 Tax=Darwinula stevensoni TaxID=69355 RepID=A0A7R8WYH5_9CRUS|nr:unnamed protein product [Darwinula stevensoni]CAG0879337.1 unnamed protein product [Darwinula stevensoni]
MQLPNLQTCWIWAIGGGKAWARPHRREGVSNGTALNRGTPASSGAVIFPVMTQGPLPQPPSLPSESISEPICEEELNGLCVDVRSYPSQLVNAAVRRRFTTRDQEKAVFDNDLEDDEILSDVDRPPVDTRLGPSGLIPGEDFYTQESPLCRSEERVIYPRAGRTKEGKMKFLINDDRYVQAVRVEKCLFPGRPCRLGLEIPLGFQTICRQKFVFRKMLALNEVHGDTITDLFKIPSCCVCYLQNSIQLKSGIS